MHPFPAHRSVCFGRARGYFTVAPQPSRVDRYSRSVSQAELGHYLTPTPRGKQTFDFLMTSWNIVCRLHRITFRLPGFIPRAKVERFIFYYDLMIDAMNKYCRQPRGVSRGKYWTRSADLRGPQQDCTQDTAQILTEFMQNGQMRPKRESIGLFQATKMAFGIDYDPNSKEMLHGAHH